MSEELIPRSGLQRLDETILSHSKEVLGIQLTLTAENAKVSLSAELQSEYIREFENESPELLERVFRAWRRRSKFMPAISEIYDLLEEEASSRYEEKEAARWQKERADDERARAEWADPAQAEWLKVLANNLAEKMAITKIGPQSVKRVGRPQARGAA